MKRTAFFCLIALTSACSTYATRNAVDDEMARIEPASRALPGYGYAPAPDYSVAGDHSSAPGYTHGVSPVPEHSGAISQAQLRHCIELDRSAKAAASRAAVAHAADNERRARIEYEARTNEARRSELERLRTTPEVNRYNQRVADLAAFTTDYNADTASAPGSAQSDIRTVTEYNQQCAGRPYYLRDMGVLTGERTTRLGGP